MSHTVLLNQLCRYKHNNLCQALHKIIAITFKKTCKTDVLLAITNSNPCGKCLSRQLFTITNSNSVAIKKRKNMLRIINDGKTLKYQQTSSYKNVQFLMNSSARTTMFYVIIVFYKPKRNW